MSAEPRTLKTEAEQAIAAQYRGARASLPGNRAAAERREAAFALFERAGLPHRRVEAWKYTDLRTLMRQAPPLAEQSGQPAVPQMFPGLDRARLLIVDGVFRPELSDLAGLDGVSVASLADVLQSEPQRIGTLFSDDRDPMLALNTALMAGGAVVTVAAGALPARALEIAQVTTGDVPAASYVRSVVDVGADATIRILQSHAGPAGVAYQTNSALELAIADGAHVTLATHQAEGDAALAIASLVARLGARSEFDHLHVTAGAAVSRFQAFIDIAGDGARLGANGTTMLSGKAHGDVALLIEHGSLGATSRVLYKNVVDGEAEGAFQGLIIVRPGAQKTDGRMMSRTLLLSDRAEFSAKPELEIYADDVQCGHGATSGQIDDEMLFYFLSRGIDRPEAERLLIMAFLAEAVETLGDGAIAAAVEPALSDWLSRRSLVREIAPA